MPYLIPRSSPPITLDAGGNGQAELEIDNTNVRWVLDQILVQTNQDPTATPIPQVKTYLNAVTEQAFQGGTYSGNMDTGRGRVILYTGDTLYVVFSGGIPGSQAWVTIAGMFDPAGAPISDA